MEYITRNLTSNPGMDQREALTALQTHPSFKPGSVVASIRRRKDQWVAEVLEPKTAEFPPKEDGGDEGGDEVVVEPKKDDGPPSDDGGDEGPSDGPPGLDGPPSPDGGDGGEKPKGKGGTEEAILHTLTQILHALQGGGAPEGMGGPDALGPDLGGPPGPPPPKGGPGGPPPGAGGPPGGPMKGPPPMKPGMTPPGGTPVGAPAFSSVQANGIMPSQGTPVPTGAEAGPVGQQAAPGVCPQDGNPEPCPIHSGGMEGLNQAVAAYSGKASTITLTTEGSDLKSAIAQARPVVENYGYTVKQAKHSDDGTQVHILASRR